MDNEPDYSKYTLDELSDAAIHINREKYVQRAQRLDEEIARRPPPVIIEDSPIEEAGDEAEPIFAGDEDTDKPRRSMIVLWAVLWAIFPPVILVFLLFSVLKPAIRGKEPNGIGYVLWVLGLILLGTAFTLPFGTSLAVIRPGEPKRNRPSSHDCICELS